MGTWSALQVRMMRTLSVYTAVTIPSMGGLVVSPKVAYQSYRRWYVLKL